MAYSYVQYVGDGSNKNFAINFPYLDSSNITVRLNGNATTAFTFLNNNTIQLNSAPASGVKVVISRETEKANRLVDFQDGSVLTEAALDLAESQLFYISQETWDRSDIVLEQATLANSAADRANISASKAYEYERLAFNHMENASDSADRAGIFKDLSAQYADQTKTAAADVSLAESAIAVNKAEVLTARTDVLLAKGLVDSQANLASVILTNAQTAASQAESIAQDALNTASEVQATANSLETTTATVVAQQEAALSAKTAAESARDSAISANTNAQSASSTATTKATLATTKATEAASSATAAASSATTATTQAGIATTKATEASASATAAASSASAAAASAATIDVSNKADVTYVNTQLGLKANTSSLAAVALSGAYSDLSGKPTLFSGAYTDLTGKPTLFSGSYTDLTDKPTIPTVPTNVSSFTNDAGYLVSSALSPYLTTATASSTYQTQSGMSSYLALSGGSLTGGLKEAKVAIASSAIDITAGNYFTKTISGALTFTVSNVPSTGTAASFILDLTNGGSATITWWSGMKWAAGTAPTLTSAGRDVLGFFTHDGGTTWTGLVLGKDIK